jgi:hypothetical protein
MEGIQARQRSGWLALALWAVALVALFTLHGARAEIVRTDERLLLIVGDVTPATARVLYESLGDEEERSVTAQLFEEPAHTPVRNFSLVARRVPKVLKIDGLKENSRYSVHFDEDDWVSFRTFPSRESGVKRELKMVALSCDRYFEDKDDEMWAQLNRNEGELDLIVHTGDQIYADDVLSRWRARLANRTVPATEEQDYRQLLDDYRNVYRITFGQPEAQKAMRHAANWMIIDDHDVFNNCDFDYLKRDPSVSIAFKAGMQAYHEYQGQLMDDMPEDTASIQRVDFVREVMNVAFVHLDLRHYRSYFSDAVHPMTGDAQFADFEKRIKEYGTREDISHIFVVSPVPLMFLTPLMASIAYLAEKEIYPTYSLFINDTLDLFDIMLPYHKKIKLVSGDIHQFVVGELCHSSGACIPQMVASGITKGSAVIDSLKLWFFYMAFRHLAPKGVGEWTIKTEQQVLLRNYGVVNVKGAEYTWHGVFPAEIPARHQALRFAFDNFHIFLQIIGALLLAQLLAFVVTRTLRKTAPPATTPRKAPTKQKKK